MRILRRSVAALLAACAAAERAVPGFVFVATQAAPSVDGHDQASLRTVLLRHRAALYDLPRVFNCRHGNVADAAACLVRHGRDWRRAPP